MDEPPLQLPDVNVLVALTNPAHQHHGRAHEWLAGAGRFATTPITEVGLLRLLLNPAVTGQQVTGPQALAIVSGVRADPRAAFLADDTSLADSRIELAGLAGHQQVTDLHLVDLAARNGAVLVTFDRRVATALTAVDRGAVLVL